MALDPEILQGFQNETEQLLKETSALLSELEETTALDAVDKLLNEYAIRIDRVMGAAKTLAEMNPELTVLKKIGSIAELCKTISYKTVEKKNPTMVPVVGSFLSDAQECIESLLKALSSGGGSAQEIDAFMDTLKQRMEVVAKYLK